MSEQTQPTEPKVIKDYIGDGVYVGFNGFDVTLWTDREEGRHWIVLEPEVMASLNRFWERMHPK